MSQPPAHHQAQPQSSTQVRRGELDDDLAEVDLSAELNVSAFFSHLNVRLIEPRSDISCCPG